MVEVDAFLRLIFIMTQNELPENFEDKVEKIFKRFDSNGDGYISKEEFITLFYKEKNIK